MVLEHGLNNRAAGRSGNSNARQVSMTCIGCAAIAPRLVAAAHASELERGGRICCMRCALRLESTGMGKARRRATSMGGRYADGPRWHSGRRPPRPPELEPLHPAPSLQCRAYTRFPEHVMKKIVVLLAFIAVPAFAAHSKAPAKANTADRTFAAELAEGNATEIAAGKMCMERCQRSEAKEFGRMMVEDHTAAGEKLTALVASKRYTLPALKSPSHLEVVLAATAPGDFDAEYMGQMVAGHQKVADLLRKETKTGKDADLKQFAAELLPTVLHHQAEAERIAAAVAEAK